MSRGEAVAAAEAGLDERHSELAFSAISKSHAGYASKLNAWRLFCEVLAYDPLKASTLAILRFLTLFRNADSARGYLSALRWFYHLHVLDCSWDGPAVQQRLRGIKAGQPARKTSPCILRGLQAQMSRVAWSRGFRDDALSYCWGHSFGFRMQSELFPLCFAAREVGGHSSVRVVNAGSSRPAIEVLLRSRKNMQHGAKLQRFCTCSVAGTVWSCPVHLFERWFSASRTAASGRLFNFSETSYVRRMRQVLAWAGVPQEQSAQMTLRAFRRGMAQQLAHDKAPLSVILKAGGWRSAAFALYLDLGELEPQAVLELCEAEDARDEECAATAAVSRPAAALGAAPPSKRARASPVRDAGSLQEVVRGAELRSTLVCAAGHTLAPHTAARAGWECNKCGARLKKGAEFYGCRVCDYDLCSRCSSFVGT